MPSRTPTMAGCVLFLLVAVTPFGSWPVVESTRDTARLGSGGWDGGALPLRFRLTARGGLRRTAGGVEQAAAVGRAVARSSSAGGRRSLLQQLGCDFPPDTQDWCADLAPSLLCDEASELGALVRRACPTTCQACPTKEAEQDQVLADGGTVEYRTGYVLVDPTHDARSQSLHEGWKLWLERSDASGGGIPVGNGRLKINHTTIIVPPAQSCDEHYSSARKLIDVHQIQAAQITHHMCAANLSATYQEAGIPHMVHSDTPLLDMSGEPISNDLTWYIQIAAEEYPRPFLDNVASNGYKNVAVVWRSGDQGSVVAARNAMDAVADMAGLQLVYSNFWAGDSGVAEVSAPNLDGLYQELYNTDLWDQMLQEATLANAEVLMVFCVGEGVSIMKRIKALGIDFKDIYVPWAPATEAWAEYLGLDGDFVVTPTQWHPDLESTCPLFGSVEAYVREYSSRFGQSPDQHAAAGTAAGITLQLGMQEVNSVDLLPEGLQSMSVDTMFGTISFSDNQRNVGRFPLGLRQLNGTLQLVLPKELVQSSSGGVLEWKCRVLYYNTEGCSDEERAVYEACTITHPSLHKAGCTQEVTDSVPLSTSFVVVVLLCCVVSAIALTMIVMHSLRKRSQAAWARIKFMELSFGDDDSSSASSERGGVVRSLNFKAKWKGFAVFLHCRKASSPMSTDGQRSAGPAGHGNNEWKTAGSLPANGRPQADNDTLTSSTDEEAPGDGLLLPINPAARQPVWKAFLRRRANKRTHRPLPGDALGLMKLNHPNLVSVKGLTVSPSGVEYLVVESVSLGNLRTFLQTDQHANVLGGEAAMGVMNDVVAGVQYLHATDNSLVHGNLRSKNIVLDDKLTAKVRIDVNAVKLSGSSELWRGLPSWRSRVGPVGPLPSRQSATAWMAPELLAGGAPTAESDIYAMGVTFWELCTKNDPYESRGAFSPMDLPSALVSQIMYQNARPALEDSIPAPIKRLLTWCWEADPEDRPSIDEVAKLLEGQSRRGSFAQASRRPLQLKKQSSTLDLLHKILPPHVASTLESGRKVKPENFKCVTIFFSDIVGFTDISSSMPPEKVMAMLDRLYHELDELTSKHELFKVETIGDAYMCVGGLTGPQPDHTLRVALFALDAIQTASKVLIDEDCREKGYVRLRVGFHSGPVVASVVGNLNPRYCLFGDTVNMASRMESNSEENRINVSPAARLLLIGQCAAASLSVRFSPRGALKIKGKGTVECAFLESIDGTSSEWARDLSLWGGAHRDPLLCFPVEGCKQDSLLRSAGKEKRANKLTARRVSYAPLQLLNRTNGGLPQMP